MRGWCLWLDGESVTPPQVEAPPHPTPPQVEALRLKQTAMEREVERVHAEKVRACAGLCTHEEGAHGSAAC